MSTLNSIKVISSDSHVLEPPDLWTSRMDSKWGDRTPKVIAGEDADHWVCLLYTSPSPRDLSTSRMPSSA